MKEEFQFWIFRGGYFTQMRFFAKFFSGRSEYVKWVQNWCRMENKAIVADWEPWAAFDGFSPGIEKYPPLWILKITTPIDFEKNTHPYVSWKMTTPVVLEKKNTHPCGSWNKTNPVNLEKIATPVDLSSLYRELTCSFAATTPVHRLFSTNYPIYSLTFNMTYNAAICFVVSHKTNFPSNLDSHPCKNRSVPCVHRRCVKSSPRIIIYNFGNYRRKS